MKYSQPKHLLNQPLMRPLSPQTLLAKRLKVQRFLKLLKLQKSLLLPLSRQQEHAVTVF